jgi:hypothetical protein
MSFFINGLSFTFLSYSNTSHGGYHERLSAFPYKRKGLTIYKKNYCCTAAIPGNTFPSKYSNIAPPPVEM